MIDQGDRPGRGRIGKRAVAACAAIAFLCSAAHAQVRKNGFDVSDASVASELILQGGPPRDGIPAIDEPVFESADEAGWLADSDRVIGVARAGIARAYPIRILNWHEIVNDDFGGEPVLVTYCPLCGTGIVFEPAGSGERLDFGVSGLLYNSDVLLYDRATESLWSQILAEAVSGPRRGERLEMLPSMHTTWGSWRAEHPDSEVLSRATGHVRDYDRDPYAGYEKSPSLYFPVEHESGAVLHPKERVLGVKVHGKTKAYPFSALAQLDERMVQDTVGEADIVVHWDRDAPVAWATDLAGRPLATVDGFWFAWYAFYPDTDIFTATGR